MKKTIILLIITVGFFTILNSQVLPNSWHKGILNSQRPEWCDTTARAIACGNNQIYVAKSTLGVHGSTPSVATVLILDNDGNLTNKTLNCDPLNSANFAMHGIAQTIADINCDQAGHILAANRRVTGKFSIFMWENDNSVPIELITLSAEDLSKNNYNWQQTSSFFDVKGDVTKDAVIILARDNTNEVYRWVITKGVVQPFTRVRLSDVDNLQLYAYVCLDGSGAEADMWVGSNSIEIRKRDKDGLKIDSVNFAAIYGQPLTVTRTHAKIFEYRGSKYMLNFNYEYSDQSRIVELYDNLKNVTRANMRNLGTYLGQDTKGAYIDSRETTDISKRYDKKAGDIDYYIKDGVVNVIIMSVNNGIKKVQFNLVNKALIANNGWRRAVLDKKGESKRSGKPDWLDHNVRSVAYGNNHIYIGKATVPDNSADVNAPSNSVASVIVLDKLGNKIKELNCDALNSDSEMKQHAHATRISDIECDDAGHVISCNTRTSGDLIFYSWENDDAPAKKLISGKIDGWQHAAYSFDVKGDINGDAKIIAVRSQLSKVYIWEIVGGVVKSETPTIIDLPELGFGAGNWGTYASVCWGSKGDQYWISTDKLITRLMNGSKVLGKLAQEVESGIVYPVADAKEGDATKFYRSKPQVFYHKGFEYIINWNYEYSDQTRLITIDKDINLLTRTSNVQLVGTYMGVESGVEIVHGDYMAYGDIDYWIEGNMLHIIVLSSNNGIKVNKFKLKDLSDIPIIADDGSWRRCVSDTVTGTEIHIRPQWCDKTANSLAVANGHIYVATAALGNGEANILVLSQKNGSYIKSLDVKLLNDSNSFDHAGTIRISDVDCDDAGHILACNVRLTGVPFRIYSWDNENSKPEELIKLTPPFGTESSNATWQHTAYYMDVKGNIKEDATILVTRSNYSSTYKWIIKEGVLQNNGNPYVTLYSDEVANPNFGSYASGCLDSDSADANIWVTSNTIKNPIKTDASGKKILQLTVNVATNDVDHSYMTAVCKVISYGIDKKYLLEWNFNSSDNVRVINVINDNVTIDDVLTVGKSIGSEVNNNKLGDVDGYIKDGFMYVFTLSANNGIKMDKIEVGKEVEASYVFTKSSKDLHNGSILYSLNESSRSCNFSVLELDLLVCGDSIKTATYFPNQRTGWSQYGNKPRIYNREVMSKIMADFKSTDDTIKEVLVAINISQVDTMGELKFPFIRGTDIISYSSSKTNFTAFSLDTLNIPSIVEIEMDVILVAKNGNKININGVNVKRGGGQIVEYNKFAGDSTHTNIWGGEIVLENTGVTVNNDSIIKTYKVIEVGSGNMKFNDNQIVLSGHQDGKTFLVENLAVDDNVTIKYIVSGLTNLSKTAVVMGGYGQFMENGVLNESIPKSELTGFVSVGYDEAKTKLYLFVSDSLNKVNNGLDYRGVAAAMNFMNVDNGIYMSNVAPNLFVKNEEMQKLSKNKVANALIIYGIKMPVIVVDKPTSIKSGSKNELNFSVKNVYPIPVRDNAKFNIITKVSGKIEIVLFDILGSRVKSLINNKYVGAGENVILETNFSDVDSGLYIYRVSIGGEVIVGEITVIK